MTEKIKDFIKDEGPNDKKDILKHLVLSDEMDFGASFDKALINGFHDSFISIHMCADFMLLSRKTQIMIARKRLWLLLRSFEDDDRSLVLNEEGCGILSINEEQTVCDFKYNRIEEKYIERREKDLKQKLEV